jgi:hypothetical protein
MKWITRERPKIDRIACPWLIKNFVDTQAQLIFVPIVRGADTACFDLAQQAAWLWAISAGRSYNFKDDHEQLAFGLILNDALYSWAKYVQTETHTWKNN